MLNRQETQKELLKLERVLFYDEKLQKGGFCIDRQGFINDLKIAIYNLKGGSNNE